MMTQEAFDVLHEHFDLIPYVDLQGRGRTYIWICDYAGEKFYTEVVEDNIWLQDGI